MVQELVSAACLLGNAATEGVVLGGADAEQHVPQMDARDGDRLPQAAPLAEEQPVGDPAVSAACLVPIMRCSGAHAAYISVSICDRKGHAQA